MTRHKPGSVVCLRLMSGLTTPSQPGTFGLRLPALRRLAAFRPDAAARAHDRAPLFTKGEDGKFDVLGYARGVRQRVGLEDDVARLVAQNERVRRRPTSSTRVCTFGRGSVLRAIALADLSPFEEGAADRLARPIAQADSGVRLATRSAVPAKPINGAGVRASSCSLSGSRSSAGSRRHNASESRRFLPRRVDVDPIQEEDRRRGDKRSGTIGGSDVYRTPGHLVLPAFPLCIGRNLQTGQSSGPSFLLPTAP